MDALTKEDREVLKLATATIWFPTRGAKDERRERLADLTTRGLVSQRLSSIGEVDQKVHFTITDAGLAALEGEYYVARDDQAEKWAVRHTDTTARYGAFDSHGHAQEEADKRNAR